MLRQLLMLIAENENRTMQDLAKALAVPDALVSQMVEQLARSGYLVDSQTCGEGCGECSLKSACGSEDFARLRFWSLTEKGQAFVAGRGTTIPV